MHIKLQKLMNAESSDGSSGGGSPPGSAAPAAAPAQGTAPAGEPLIDQLSRLIDSKLADQRNGIFADLRKSGAFGGKAPKSETETQTNAPPSTTDDVKALIARERAFSRASSSVRLNETQMSRMEKAFELEKPDNPADWVKGYVADLGIGQTESAVQQPQPKAPVRFGLPVSDGGAPAPVTRPSDEIEPWKLTSDDVRAVIRSKGMQAAGNQFRQQMRSALSGRRLSLKK